MLGSWFFVPPPFFFMLEEVAYAIFIISLMFSSFLLILSTSWSLFDSREHILWVFLISCSHVDSLLFRSAVQLQSWNFCSLDSWVTVTIFLCISYFLGFSLLFCVFPKLSSSGYKIKRLTSWVLLCLKLLLFLLSNLVDSSLCRILHWNWVSLRALVAFLYYLLAASVANVLGG